MSTIRIYRKQAEFAVGKIVCIGRNYAEHAREMNAPVSEVPVLFLKPSSAIIHSGEPIVRPGFSNEMHHEVELVVAIGQHGKNIAREDAWNYVLGYGVGLDMTLRDVQKEAKSKGLPWSVAKGFDTSAPVSDFIEREAIPNPHTLEIRCTVNGAVRQHATTDKMIFRIDHLISYISTVFTLNKGDLIFTGTPEGVGPVQCGDTIDAELIHHVTTTHHIQ